MNTDRPKQRHRWFAWDFGCSALILVSLIATGGLGRFTTVVIDNKNTVRLGGVVPLGNKKIRDSVLGIMSHLNGAKFTVVADKSAKFSTVVEVMDSIRRSGATLIPPPRTDREELR